VERLTDSGLLIEERSSPGTVGPEAGGGAITVYPPWLPSAIRPQPWAGWPSEWATPNWNGRIAVLTDTAWACLDLNSSIYASMPPYLVNAAPSLSADWMTNPNPLVYASWTEFAKQLMWDYQLGEVFVVADARYSTGWPARFHVVPPWAVNVDFAGDGTRTYHIGDLPVPAADVLHIRYAGSVDDARGHGPLEAGGARLIAATALLRYASEFAASGGIPNSVLVHPARLSAEQAAELQSAWVTARMSSIGLPAVLSGGVDFKTLQIDPTSMALVDLSRWNESRIAILLGVPPFLMGLPSGGDSLTYTNVQSLFDYHWRAGLRPRAVAVMSALSGWLLPRGTSVEVNRDEYVRPGPLERAQTWEILIRIGVLTAEEVRVIERYSNSAPSDTLPAGVLQ